MIKKGFTSTISLTGTGLAKESTLQSLLSITSKTLTDIYYSSAYENRASIAASGGTPPKIVSINGYNNNSSDQFIMLFNQSISPVDTTGPLIAFKIPAKDNFSFDMTRFPIQFSNKFWICNSTTAVTLTAGAADCLFYITFYYS